MSITSAIHPFPTGWGKHPDWQQAADACLQRLGPLPEHASLAFVYVTDTLAPQLRDILRHLKAATGIPHWVGGVGAGIFCNDQEFVEDPAVAVMVCPIAADAFRVIPTVRDSWQKFILSVGRWSQTNAEHVGLVHGDPRNAMTPRILEKMAADTHRARLLGGLIASRSDYHQVADGVTSGGVSGVLFSDAVSMSAGLAQGCLPIGPVHTITGGERNVVTYLDDQPATEVFLADIGDILTRRLDQARDAILAGVRPSHAPPEDYMIRPILDIDPERHQLTIGDVVRPGDTLRFCRRDGPSADQALREMVRDLRACLPARPRGAVYISGLGRGRFLFSDTSELATLQQELGGCPLVGFYASGEIADARLHGYSGILVLFH